MYLGRASDIHQGDPKEAVLANTNGMGVNCGIKAVGFAPTVQQVMPKTICLDEAVTYFEKLKNREDNLIKVVVVDD